MPETNINHLLAWRKSSSSLHGKQFIVARKSAIVVAEIRIAVAQTTAIIAACWLNSLLYNNSGINGFALLEYG